MILTMTDGTFGVGDSGGWHGPASPDVNETADETAPEGDLGNGHFIKIDPAQWHALMHRPEVVAAVAQRADEICDTANSMVAMDPRAVQRIGKGEPAYKTSVQNEGGPGDTTKSGVTSSTRPRARVFPANFLGALDEAIHSTLLKAMDMYPSDPFPETPEPVEDSTEDEAPEAPEAEVE